MPTKNQSKQVNKVKAYLRQHQDIWLKDPNITSVGIGLKPQTGDVCIQFTVHKKGDKQELELEGISTRPIETECKLDDGTMIATDILERDYKPAYQLLDNYNRAPELESLPESEKRRGFNATIKPGMSVSNFRSTAGTLGAIVYGKTDGVPYILSNWHVLQGNDGIEGDAILQPGPADGGSVTDDACSHLTRSFLGRKGDCAIASIQGRDFDEDIMELNEHPEQVAEVELGDKVVKSGRTTGVTFGIVTRIHIIIKLNYGGSTGVREIGSFEIRPDPDHPAERGEISMGGDSGSLWMLNRDSDDENGIAVGLHYAGESSMSIDPGEEHALACYIDQVLDKLEVSFIDPLEQTMTDDELLQELAHDVEELQQAVTAIASQMNTIAQAANAQQVCDCQKPAGLPQFASASNNVAAVQDLEGLKVYGKWCGPGHGGGTPVDAVDEACMRHDSCYNRRGYFDCDCDATLVRELGKAVISPGVSAGGRAAGIAAASYFTIAPCMPHFKIGGVNIPYGIRTGGRTVIIKGTKKVVKKVARGAKKVWKKVKSWF